MHVPTLFWGVFCAEVTSRGSGGFGTLGSGSSSLPGGLRK
jgi:hypothetical protein